MTSSDLLLSSYDYDLPSSHIAQLPASPAHNAKLLIATPAASHKSYNFHHTTFFDLPNHLSQEHLLFFNETKVFKARIPLQNVKIIRKRNISCKNKYTALKILFAFFRHLRLKPANRNWLTSFSFPICAILTMRLFSVNLTTTCNSIRLHRYRFLRIILKKYMPAMW